VHAASSTCQSGKTSVGKLLHRLLLVTVLPHHLQYFDALPSSLSSKGNTGWINGDGCLKSVPCNIHFERAVLPPCSSSFQAGSHLLSFDCFLVRSLQWHWKRRSSTATATTKNKVKLKKKQQSTSELRWP